MVKFSPIPCHNWLRVVESFLRS